MRFKLIILLTTLRSALGGPFLFPNLNPLHKLFEVGAEEPLPLRNNMLLTKEIWETKPSMEDKATSAERFPLQSIPYKLFAIRNAMRQETSKDIPDRERNEWDFKEYRDRQGWPHINFYRKAMSDIVRGKRYSPMLFSNNILTNFRRSMKPKPFRFPILYHALPVVFRHKNKPEEEKIERDIIKNEQEKLIYDAIDSIQPNYVDTSCRMVVCRPAPFNICFCYDGFEKLKGARKLFGV